MPKNNQHIKNNTEQRFYLGGYEVYRKTIPIAIEIGSASLELDNNANIISYEEYHPFGTTSYRSGNSETEVSLKRCKYIGKERDEELLFNRRTPIKNKYKVRQTGLYYYGARFYAAWICRFVSVDPLQFEYLQLTPFNCAGNKPITHIDIDGMQGTGNKPTVLKKKDGMPSVEVDEVVIEPKTF